MQKLYSVYMGLDCHSANHAEVGWTWYSVHIFLIPTAKMLTQDVGIRTLYPVQPTLAHDVHVYSEISL